MSESSAREGAFSKIFVAVVVGLLTSAAAPWWLPMVFPPACMGQLLYDTNLQGSDISNIDKVDVNTEGECSSACLQNAHCRSMTFVKHPDKPGGICWLKDTVPPKGSTMGFKMVSAVKISPGMFGTECH
jgi:hypothetical protein